MKKNTLTNLVAAYNEAAKTLGKKPVKSFKDLPTAERRTKAILKELASAGKGTKPVRGPLDFLNNERNLPRKGSLTDLVLQRVTKEGGATMAQLKAVVTRYDKKQGKEPENTHNRAVRWLRHLHLYSNLDLKMADDGKTIIGALRK